LIAQKRAAKAHSSLNVLSPASWTRFSFSLASFAALFGVEPHVIGRIDSTFDRARLLLLLRFLLIILFSPVLATWVIRSENRLF